MQTRMAEVVQTCTLLVTGRLEEVLDPAQQSLKYPAVQLDGLTAVLTKFRFTVILNAMLVLHELMFAYTADHVAMMLTSSLLQGDWRQGFFIWTSLIWEQQAACGEHACAVSVSPAAAASPSRHYSTVCILQSFLKKQTVDQVIRQLQRSGRS